MNRTAATIFFVFAAGVLVCAQAQTTNKVLRTLPTAEQRAVVPLPIPAAPPLQPAISTTFPLVWDADQKTYDAKHGEMSAPFVFLFTNTSSSEVVISNLQTSCGCTAAQMPQTPWRLPPGTNGEIKATMNLTGKPSGRTTKSITVHTSHGSKALMVNVNIPLPPPVENARGDRNANMELAKANRQAVFAGDCRSCHVDQGVGKLGKELYAADCGICHDSNIRAAMVPDLRAPKAPRDRDYWVNWITYGRPGSMMPAFGAKDGGPLSQEQIDSLVKYLMAEFPQGPAVVPAVIPAPAAPVKTGAGQ